MPGFRLSSLLAVPALLGACASPPGGFDSPEPAARLNAILDADATGDRGAIPDLIESLGHDDPLVRMAAIRTLEDLTGETHGYRYWAPEPERREAARAWIDWYRRTSPAGGARTPTGPAAPNADKGGDAP